MDSAGPVDLTSLRSVAGDDNEFLAELINTFLSDTDTQMAGLTQALATGDMKTAQRQAHTIKGSSATLGAERMRAQALAMEMAAKAGDAAKAAEGMPELRVATQEACDHLREVLKKL